MPPAASAIRGSTRLGPRPGPGASTPRTAMPSWLVDDPTVVYLVLGVLAVGLLLALWLKRDKPWRFVWIAGLAAVALLALTVFLLDLFIVTAGEQIVANIQDMRAAVEKRDPAGIMKHVSKDFRWLGKDRAWFELSMTAALKSVVDDAAVFDIEPPVVDRATKMATVS